MNFRCLFTDVHTCSGGGKNQMTIFFSRYDDLSFSYWKKSNRKKKIQIFLGICDRVWFYYSVSNDADKWKVIRGWSGIYDVENIEMFVTFDSVTKGVLFHGWTCHQRYERYFSPPFKSVYFCRNLCRTQLLNWNSNDMPFVCAQKQQKNGSKYDRSSCQSTIKWIFEQLAFSFRNID